MKKLLQLFLFISLGLFLNSCYYDSYEDELAGGVPEIPDTQVISFASEIQPLFARCTGCHKGGSPSPDLREGTSYNSIVPALVKSGDADGSKLYNYIPGKGHFDVGFTLKADELALIKAWINQGAKNN